MSTLQGLPAHILLNHFVIVLLPLTAILAILCAVWPAARRRLVWLVLALAVVDVVITPLTVSAGEWLIDHADKQSAMLDYHAELGDTMIYFAAALLIAAVLLAVLHVRQRQSLLVPPLVQGLVMVLVIAASVAALVQTYRTGDSGARSAWGEFVSSLTR